MARVIGINVPFMNEAREQRVRAAAAKLGFEIRLYNDEQARQEGLGDCEVLFGMFPVETLKDAHVLCWFHCSFAGVDRFLSDSVYPHEGVVLTNSSGAYGIAISEHLVCTLLMLLRRMPEYTAIQKARHWYSVGEIRSVYNSVITVVGMGDIGGNFAHRVKAMGAKVRGVRRTVKPKPDYVDEVYLIQDLDQAIDGADVVVLCVPGTKETQQIMTRQLFEKMKPGAIFMNVGRGNAVDQEALCEGLCSGRLGGAAIDVAQPEPLPCDHPLWSAPNIIITPHVSGNMALPLTCDLLVDIFLDNLKRYAAGEELAHIVDRKAGY